MPLPVRGVTPDAHGEGTVTVGSLALRTGSGFSSRLPFAMSLRAHKTKIVATIGPASASPEMLERLIRAGVDIARLNMSHGDSATHQQVISSVQSAARAVGRKVAIMADLAGPKMRLGQIAPEPIRLYTGDSFILTSEEVIGNAQRVSMSFRGLPQVV